VASERFVERVNAMSQGRLVLKLNPGGAIVPKTKEFDGVETGVLDWAHASIAGYWVERLPTAPLFTYTIGGLSPVEAILWYVAGGGRQLHDKLVEGHKMRVFSSRTNPPETFLYSSKPLRSVADIKGLKVRTSGDGGAILSRMGAAVVGMPSTEIYEAMQRGVIDAFERSFPASDLGGGMQEVSKYMYLSPVRQPSELCLTMVNEDSWAKLSPDLQMLFEDALMADAMQFYAEMVVEDTTAVQQYIDYGVIVEPAAEDIVSELVRQAKIFYDEKAAEDPFAAEVLTSIREFQTAVRATWPRL